ncbi:MAG: TRAP transporter small permease [Oscillospiraceae bacterium]|nr:TRAP transporter small permease [Oscillospiraceae bacterium]
MKTVDRIVRTIATWMDYASCVFLFIMMAFVTVYVIVRAVFGYAIFGTFEVVQLCSLLVVSLSLVHNEYESGNITIDFLDNFLGDVGKRILMIFSLLVSAVISAICSYRMYQFMLAKIKDASVTANLSIPVYIFLLIMFISLALLTVCIVFKLIARIVGYELGSDVEKKDSGDVKEEILDKII